jgi:hypothetical protein
MWTKSMSLLFEPKSFAVVVEEERSAVVVVHSEDPVGIEAENSVSVKCVSK